MKSLFTYLLFFCVLTADAVDYVELRNLFEASPNSEAKAKLLLDKTKNATESEAILLGYKGGANMAMANHVVLPTSKLSSFNTGKEMLEKAIKAVPYSIELRFIRFSIQCNVPSFLGYSGNLLGDKIMLIGYLKSEVSRNDNDLKTRIKSFLLNSKHCNEVEKSNIKDL